MTDVQALHNRNRFTGSYWPGVILLLVTMVIGLLCYKDYGMSWDEPAQHGIGRLTYNYAVNGDKALLADDERGLGTGFELPLYTLEHKLHLTDTRDIYLMRHIVTHLFFLIGVFCGYVLCMRLFRNQFIACLGFVLLAFHPRIYAHSYFNTKDIPFLSAFLIAMLACHLAFERKKIAWYLVMGIACGYATSIRAMGILFVPVISLFLLSDIIEGVRQKEGVKYLLLSAVTFFVGYCGMLYVAWPVLWSNPIFYFRESFHNLATIVWNGQVLFRGQFYGGANLPWDYMPVWFCITMPELWLAAGLAGLAWIIISFVRKPLDWLSNTNERNFLLYAACFTGPILAMILFHGVNIDDWRHLYFIYPSFVILALFVVSKLMAGKRRLAVGALCVLQVLATGAFMIGSHPYEQVYFNYLVSHDNEYIRKHYDLEYWGVAYKQGFDYILAHETSDSIKIHAMYGPVINNVKILPEAQRKRIQFVTDEEHADYFLTNFRMHPDDYPYPNVFYEIKVLNNTILRVYKLR